jgi:CHAD domain-containing protein
MSYQLERGETEAETIRRCGREQLDLAITKLSDEVKVDPINAVHDARKALKKARSLLRLARGTLKASARRTLNAALRDAGRQLSDARDAEVMIEAVDDLSSRYTGQLPQPTFEAIKHHLEGRAATARGSLTVTGEVVEELKSLRAGVDEWPLRRDGWIVVGNGLERSYRRGRRAYRRAQRKPTSENLHAWRKRVKDLWYHVRLLEPLSPGALHGCAVEAHQLSDLLGEEHDLAVLRETLLVDAVAVPADLDSVVALIEHRREQLQAEAMQVGARLYVEKPKAFRRRIKGYWKTWRADRAATQTPVHLPGRTGARTTAA